MILIFADQDPIDGPAPFRLAGGVEVPGSSIAVHVDEQRSSEENDALKVDVVCVGDDGGERVV